jgi:formate hydrogenlyase transcriptional activator
MVGEHRFRSDLFYRLNVFPIHVPALRERPEDIPLLVRYFAELFSRRMKKSIETIPAETMTALIAYDWPGNVRELQNVVERAVILSRHGVLRIPASDLTTAKNPSSVREEPQSSPKRIRSTVPALTREQVLEALKEARGRVGGSNGAAARLGLKRTTLIAQMKKLAIDPRTVMTNS